MIETKLTIVFDKKKLKAAGKTEEDYMDDIREYYSRFPVTEKKHNVFVMSGEHDITVLLNPIMDFGDEELGFLSLLKRCELHTGGEVEDIISDTIRWYEKYDVKRPPRIHYRKGN